jgi:spoIIIJ-associated protein
MSVFRRRIFWGQSLAQAMARAARYYGVPVERLAYRVHEKRHGFVKHPRAVLIEVDPGAPALAPAAESAPLRPVAEPAPARPAAERPPAQPATVRAGPPPPSPAERRPPRAEPPREEESWDTPDEESLYAAIEAARSLLHFAGLELEPRGQLGGERLEVVLEGPDAGRLHELGVELLDELELLLPKAVQSLSGRHVRCRIDGAGLRVEREVALRARAREVAARVLASGDEELLAPLNPAERRIVHLELAERAGVRTESVGSGFLKRLRISPAAR